LSGRGWQNRRDCGRSTSQHHWCRIARRCSARHWFLCSYTGLFYFFFGFLGLSGRLPAEPRADLIGVGGLVLLANQVDGASCEDVSVFFSLSPGRNREQRN
jgi:hypothetical protein